ncbi:MAG: hypothetical protein JWN33_609 [Candidatus Saccharibacteria bacterium]|nr:hypothetical protein [Candidatus Saccharibacteria bacterium]
MSFRGWLTIITFVLLAVVVVFAWPELVQAWQLLARVNLWILSLLIPVQLFSYYAIGGLIFSYLRAKGNVESMSRWYVARLSLELNFVNHILPSGGAAGFSYLGWILHRYGVSAGRSTMSQIVRFVLIFASFVLLLVIAVAMLILDNNINRVVILLSSGLALVSILGTVFFIYLLASKPRLDRVAGWLTRITNRLVKKVTRGRKANVLKRDLLKDFFNDLHLDYVAIRRDKRILIRPFIWSILATLADVALLYIAFLALGYHVNPASLLIAFGLSSIGSVFTVTPGGAGVYEAIMIAFLATSGVPPDVAIAGTLLARVVLVLGTILFGYVFYQMTLVKYGKRPA